MLAGGMVGMIEESFKMWTCSEEWIILIWKILLFLHYFDWIFCIHPLNWSFHPLHHEQSKTNKSTFAVMKPIPSIISSTTYTMCKSCCSPEITNPSAEDLSADETSAHIAMQGHSHAHQSKHSGDNISSLKLNYWVYRCQITSAYYQLVCTVFHVLQIERIFASWQGRRAAQDNGNDNSNKR